MKTKTRKAAPMSASRQKLADLLAARDAILPTLKALEAQRDRLDAIRPDDSVAGELAKLTTQETEAMSLWSTNGQGKPPVANVKQRAALERKQAESSTAAESARRASAGVQAQIDDESRKYEALASPIKLAQFEVLIEAAEPEIIQFERVHAEAAVRVERIHRLGHLITDAAHAEVDEKTKADLFALNTAFFNRLDKVDARRRPDESVGIAAHAAWSALASALNSDANATLSPKSKAIVESTGENVVDLAEIAVRRLESLARLERAKQ
jgi:hypothetical protein